MPDVTSIARATEDLTLGRRSSTQITRACIEAATDPSGEGARTFISFDAEGASSQALQVDNELKENRPRGILSGIPISIKDLFDVRGQTTTAGSKILSGEPPAAADAPAVARLRSAGAILIGRTNMTEFAFSGLGINPHYGTPRSPYRRDEGRIPGGSSSGAGVSVSDGMALGALGTDTGGSVRIPAALCGITGFKPTASSVSCGGAFPLSPSLDSVGVLAPTVDCCAILYSVISGRSTRPLHSPPLSQMKLGVLQGYLLDDLDNQVAKAFAAVLTVLSQSGAIIQDVSCPAIGTIPELNRDGGIPAFESCAIHKELLATRRSEYDPRVLSRILRGAKISAEAHSELISGRRNVISGASECFRGFDAILVPTVPRIAPTIQEATLDDASYAAANFAMLRNPSVVNFLNGCALSVPCHQPGDAPVGLMIFGMEDQDAKILSVGLSIQKALDAPGLRHPASLAIQ